jgi:hypothetical protein
MKESDQLATLFITPFGIYCYITMPFGLKNAVATYQRCMNTVFGELIGWTVEAYVDDIVVKSKHVNSIIDDLGLTFTALKAKNVKLNPKKCVFGGPTGHAIRLYSFLARHRGQPRENFRNNKHGPDSKLKGSATSYGMPGRS